MVTENLSTLKIYKLTQEQFNKKLADGSIEQNALYLTPNKSNNVDLSEYATYEYVDNQQSSLQEQLDTLSDLVGETSVQDQIAAAGTELPTVTTENDGSFLRVVDGKWVVATIENAEEASF